MNGKSPSVSTTSISQLMTPNDSNFFGRVYGGVIMSLADRTAYVAAVRHSDKYCITASVDRINFHEPIEIGELVTLYATVNYAHKTSMEIGIRIESENLKTRKKRHCCTCYFTMVAVDEKGKPTPVPAVLLETAEEKRRYKEAEKRREERLKSLT